MGLFLLRIPWGYCEVTLFFVFWSLCACLRRWRAAFHMHWALCGDNLRVQVSGNAGAAGLVPVGCTEWARLCHLQVCVQGQPEAGNVLLSLVTALWQWLCWSKWATIFSSIFVIAGIIPALSFEPTVVQLRETPVPYSAKHHQVLRQAVVARKTLIPNASKPRTNVLYW